MTEIKKKTWPNEFEKIVAGKKNVDLRLADFKIKEGDVLILEEYDPKKQEYTGRSLTKKVKNLDKVRLSDFHTPEEIEKFGHWIVEME